jgi:serine/threonine-protein kinase
MECLHGGSLETYHRLIGPLQLGEAAAICFRVGQALNYIHHEGFAHNDVKPDNVLFRRPLEPGEEIEPVLIDFGVAAKLVRPQVDGSVVYMAPERLQEARDPSAPETGDASDTAKGDVWSIGILLYRLLVGREPFIGVTDRSITSAIQRAMPIPMARQRPDIPKDLDEFVVEGCLAKDPRVRVSMARFVGFIQRYAGDLHVRRGIKARRVFPWQR